MDEEVPEFSMKKIYTELFYQYIKEEKEDLTKQQIKKENESTIEKMTKEGKLHPHHFYFLDFVPDGELNNLFGVDLITFSNTEKKYNEYKKIGAFKDIKINDVIQPVSKNKTKSFFDTPNMFSLDYNFDIENGVTDDLQIQLLNKEFKMPLVKVEKQSDFASVWGSENINLSGINSDIINKTAYGFINRVHGRVLNIFKLIISMKNEKLEMTVALNGFLSKYQGNYDTKKEDLIVIKDWEELKTIFANVDKDPADSEEIKQSHKKYATLTSNKLKSLLEREEFKEEYKKFKKKDKKTKEEEKILERIRKIKNKKSKTSHIDNIRFKQFQHEVFITINFVKQHIKWLKQEFKANSISGAVSNFFINYLDKHVRQLELLLKTVESYEDMKKLELRLVNSRIEFFEDINIHHVSRVTFELHNPAVTKTRQKDLSNRLGSEVDNAQKGIGKIAMRPFRRRKKKDEPIPEETLRFLKKYPNPQTIIDILEKGKDDTLPNDNANRVAYNKISSKDIEYALAKYFTSEAGK